MSLHKKQYAESFDYNDDGLYSEYLLKKARKLPDKWKPRTSKYEGETVPFIYFRDELSDLKDHIKAYAYQLFTLSNQDPKTINTKVTTIRNFIKTLSIKRIDENTCLKEAFVGRIASLHLDIREHFFAGEITNKLRRTRDDAIVLLEFILFLDLYSDANRWVFEFDLSKELPDKLVRYFKREELEVYRLQFNKLIEKSRTPALDWLTTYEVVKFLDNITEPHYGKSTIIICLEAGLRISEIRTLQVDCLTPVTAQEQEMVAKHFIRLKREAPIELDYSESRWLHYHVVKGKGGDIVPGTPILVGQRVIKAVEDIMEYTKGFREESGSDMLFLNRVRSRKKPFRVRSYSALLYDLRELFELGLPILRFHQLRATFATILHRLRVPIGMIEKYMNHVSSDVTACYISDQRKESSDAMTWLLDNDVNDLKDNEQLEVLQQDLILLVGTFEFIGLSHNSRISLFERLAKRYNIKIGMSDHGACVLPRDTICPNGFEDVLPCHASDCKTFYPDKGAEDFFVALLENNEQRLKEIEKLLVVHGDVDVNIDMLEIAKRSYENIIKKIKGAA